MTKAILAVDLGTSRLRAGLFDRFGTCLAVSAFEYPIISNAPGAAEQDPEKWLEGLGRTVQDVLGRHPVSQIEGMAFSGQMHGTVLVDQSGAPLCPAIIWCDQRGGEAVQWIREEIGSERYDLITGNPLASGFQAATLAWIRTQNPELLQKAEQVFLPKDFLIHCLTGDNVTEPTDAVSTGLLDLNLPGGHSPHWSEELIGLLGMRRDQFPSLCPSLLPQNLKMAHESSRRFGLPEGLPILAFGGDAVLGATFTLGDRGANQAAALISSGGQLLVARDQAYPAPDQGIHLLPQMQPGKWFSMAAFLSAGLSLEWWRQEIESFTGRPMEMEYLLDAAGKVPPGSEGLCFVPHIAGERTPLLDPDAQGSFWGIHRTHTLGHFARAILEGVSMSFRQGLEILETTGGPIKSLLIGGGGSKSPLWCQIFADVTQREVGVLQDLSETSLIGAALAAAQGIGWDCSSWHPKQTGNYQPNQDHSSVLSRNYAQFKEMPLILRQMRQK